METAKRPKPSIESPCPIEGIKVIYPKLFPDDRGFFSETYNADEWKDQIGWTEPMVQDNHSWSHYGVLRGLHAQPRMGKLVSVITGSIYDVAVDARPGSKTFGQHFGIHLDDKQKNAFWVPGGFLHGFQVTSKEGAHVYYKCSATYDNKTEFGCNPFDPDLGVEWPDKANAIVSDKDKAAPQLKDLGAKINQ